MVQIIPDIVLLDRNNQYTGDCNSNDNITQINLEFNAEVRFQNEEDVISEEELASLTSYDGLVSAFEEACGDVVSGTLEIIPGGKSPFNDRSKKYCDTDLNEETTIQKIVPFIVIGAIVLVVVGFAAVYYYVYKVKAQGPLQRRRY